MQDYDFDLLCQLAFQSWLDRGQPLGTPVIDDGFVKSQLGEPTQVYTQHVATSDTMTSSHNDE
jgi:hypothetical protein